jgi:hemolysin III
MAMEMAAGHRREMSIGEEIANCVSHGLGLVAALVATPFLIVKAAHHGGAAIVGASIFAGTTIVLYLASTLYHAMPRNRAKRVFRTIDHGAIYLLIAGTYTPFTLGVLRGGWGWTLFGLIWGLAILGVTLKSIGGFGYPKLSAATYVAMGWLALIAIRPIFLQVSPAGLMWLGAGGLAYTAGVAFFAATRVPYAHFIWHLFVLAGTACHFFAVLGHAV